MTLSEQQLLEMAEAYLREFVAPQANEIDKNAITLSSSLQGLGKLSLLALQVPTTWQGSQLSEMTFRRFQVLISRYSGALAFLQTQHQSAGSLLAKSENLALQQRYLPRMGKGEVLVGVGFSQLRRPGKPMMKAEAVADGYVLNGEVPWVTGFELFHDFIIAATLPDGRAVYGVVPFSPCQEAGGKINFSAPMKLAGMPATNTVQATLNNWFLPETQVVFIQPSGKIHENDRKNVLNHGFFALGCAQAGLDILQDIYSHKHLGFLHETYGALQKELQTCANQMFAALSSESIAFESRLKLRVWAINLAGRCAQGAVIASSGAANYFDHPAQRVYREALVFSVSGQTQAVMEASLGQLISATGEM